MNDDCPFCDRESAENLLCNEVGLAFFDAFPVSRGHVLVVSRRHMGTWFEASVEEQVGLLDLVNLAKGLLDEEFAPDGYNLGLNVGAAAGQTVPHLSIHLIPRYGGDVDNPSGGVRFVIPALGNYGRPGHVGQRAPTTLTRSLDFERAAAQAVEDAIRTESRALVALAPGLDQLKAGFALVERLVQSRKCLFDHILLLVNSTKERREALDLMGGRRHPKVEIRTVQDLAALEEFDLAEGKQALVTVDLSDSEIAACASLAMRAGSRVHVAYTTTASTSTARSAFGDPVYEYSYRQAVLDGYLVDHETPTRILTKRSQDGTLMAFEKFVVLDDLPKHVEWGKNRLNQVMAFNAKVGSDEEFNRVVCRTLAGHLGPADNAKTVVYCSSIEHAAMVEALLKQALWDQHGELEDDFILRITGDTPGERYGRFCNERLPQVAVVVDLFLGEPPVPRVDTLVFLRRERSPSRFAQMLGMAAQKCDAIGKERFKIFDAVDVYAEHYPYSDIRPVITNPTISFAQLLREHTEHLPMKRETRRELLERLVEDINDISDGGVPAESDPVFHAAAAALLRSQEFDPKLCPPKEQLGSEAPSDVVSRHLLWCSSCRDERQELGHPSV